MDSGCKIMRLSGDIASKPESEATRQPGTQQKWVFFGFFIVCKVKNC